MKNRLEVLDRLIATGQMFRFNDNRVIHSDGESYSRATPELLAWVIEVESYIFKHYDDASGPSKALKEVKKAYFNGSYERDFDRSLTKLRAALIACKSIEPDKTGPYDPIIALLKNTYFWIAATTLVSGAYLLGLEVGKAKFDTEKIELSRQVEIMSDSLKAKEKPMETRRDTSVTK